MVQSEYDRIVRRMIEAMGHITQSFGVGRTMGQIFAYLYFSREPQSLDDITSALEISKGSASMGVRQLEQWEAVEKTEGQGDRKDYYLARDAFGRIIKKAALDLSSKKLEYSSSLLGEMESRLGANSGKRDKLSEEDKFIMERIEKIHAFQDKITEIWNNPLFQIFFK
jgi:DNA-binding transcriptional regulator GbsR (MarR family)